MNFPMDVVTLSRLQFAMTAMYHFLFVPLTMGLVFLVAIMETLWVVTKRPIWRQITLFWGTLFGINFAMGVATGITLEFQFGTNWAYYAHYVGDVFGAPLALEGMMAFFLEATLIGLFFFGWQKLSSRQHLMCTWLLAVGTNLSALWILIANGWMQHPVGARFNVDTMRMEVTDFAAVVLNPVAQTKFVHTVSASGLTGAAFVVAVSAWFLLRQRHREVAHRSMAVALTFGLCAALVVAVMGDESGFEMGKIQPMKLAAIEAQWKTQPAPAAFSALGWPDMDDRTTHFEIEIPALLGLIATRSLDEQVMGIDDLLHTAQGRIRNGLSAYEALEGLRKDRKNAALLAQFAEHEKDLGYALLLQSQTPNILQASDEQIVRAAQETVPNVPVLFWSFRAMVGIGVALIALFGYGYYVVVARKREPHRLFLWAALLALPLPWVAAELGWMVAEMGRQPWTIEGVLPTFLSASSTQASNVWLTLLGFVLFYSALFVVDVFLMLKYIRLGPQPLDAPGVPGVGAIQGTTGNV